MLQKRTLSILFVSLLAISCFAFIPNMAISQEPFTLQIEAAVEHSYKCQYDSSVRLPPGEQDLQLITFALYINDNLCQRGGTKYTTTPPTYYRDVSRIENAEFEVKVPLEALKEVGEQYYNVLFEHFEVWDMAGTPQLEWLDGVQERYVYTGEFLEPNSGRLFTRITKLVAYPKLLDKTKLRTHSLEEKYVKAPKETLDNDNYVFFTGPNDWMEPYLAFRVNNPVGGGNKKLMAVYYPGEGARTEHIYVKTVLSPDATLLAFLNKEIDVTTDMIRTSDIDTLSPISVITSTPGYHECYVASNLRRSWMGPVTGGAPGSELRKAIARVFPKDTLISMLFKYIVVRLDTCVPPSLAEWYEPGTTKYTYDPKVAYDTLIAGSWTYNSGYGTWEHVATGAIAGGDDHIIQIMSPLYEVAPTSFTVVARLVDEMNALKIPAGYPGAGNPVPIRAEHKPTDFNTIIDKVFRAHDFEMYFLCYGLGNTPDFLYAFFHSSQDIEWGDNGSGINNPDLDDLLEIVMFGLDHTAKVAACKQAQIMLSNMLPWINVYSRNYFNAHQNDQFGVILWPGVGIDNDWTWMNIKGMRLSPIYKTPLTQMQGNMTIWHNGEKCESVNLAQASSVYSARILDMMYDGLMQGNPYTGADEPWLAKSWNVVGPWTGTTPHGVSVTDGMYVEYTLDDRVVHGKVRWHDGEVFDADDIIFSWKYIWDNGLTQYFTFYEHLVDVAKSADGTKVTAYWDMTSQWLKYNAAGSAACGFAPQVWGKIDTDGDTLNYLDDGDIEGDASIRSYKPQDHLRSALGDGHYPAEAAFPWLSQAIGTGYMVLYSISADGFHTHLFVFDERSHTTVTPGISYWKKLAEIKSFKVECFYHIGDVTLDSLTNVDDLASIAKKSGWSGPLPPEQSYGGFIQEDVVHDGTINVYDLATSGKNYGKTGEY